MLSFNRTFQRVWASNFTRALKDNTFFYRGVNDLHPLRCPAVPCRPMPVLHSPLRHPREWQKNAARVSLDPSAPAATPSAPWAAFTLSHISTAKQECLPLLLCLNLISSLPPSNSPITLASLALPFFFFPPLFKTWKKKKRETEREKEREKKNASPPVKNTGVAIQSVIVGKMGPAVFVKCRVGESVCIFGHMHMKRCPLQTYIRTEGLNSLLRLSKKAEGHKVWDWIHTIERWWKK